MYENGEKLNRHARKELHRKKQKRKFTPLQYNSYESYAQEQDNHMYPNSLSYVKRVDNGWIPWHRRWWQEPIRCLRKKLLKEDAHEKERAHYRQQLSGYDEEENDIDTTKRFSDPWIFS